MMGVLHLSSLFLLSLLRPGLSHVVDMFQKNCEMFFLNGKTPNIPRILVQGTVPNTIQKRYTPICQFYHNAYRFATLYDTTNRIPVFSAYKFTGDAGTGNNIDETWKIEPQLEDDNASKSMADESQGVRYRRQATNQDYINANGVNRGHLFPSMHAYDVEAKESTYTLTNIVPQVVSFNGKSWNDMETNVKNIMTQSCNGNNNIKAYVVTGAVPSDNPVEKLNNRVNIPSSMWTAYCCENPPNQWHSGAHWGENKKKGRNG
ncbi:endonuclease domain-containing 1 protein-like [Esox lucius]|uniref:endonuclease domain-containing 1 protein-like n=1 Tax=Esox lucius TaxID=8010 RepID=UPI001476CA8F|nr:endonuclease domain-containing 1 protein-like [Esox lucius]